MPRVKTGRYPGDIAPSAVDALRELAGHWPDRELAVALNRMRCRTGDGETWTTVRVREMRERLGLAEYNADDAGAPMVSLAKAAEQLGICVGSAKTLALRGILPATQAMKGAQWLVPVEALTSEAVRIAGPHRGPSSTAPRQTPALALGRSQSQRRRSSRLIKDPGSCSTRRGAQRMLTDQFRLSAFISQPRVMSYGLLMPNIHTYVIKRE